MNGVCPTILYKDTADSQRNQRNDVKGNKHDTTPTQAKQSVARIALHKDHAKKTGTT